jgi:hypothetical protein
MGYRKTRKLNDYSYKSLGLRKDCLTNYTEVSSTLLTALSLCFDFAQHPEFVEGPKGNVTTSRNSSVSNVHNSLSGNCLEEK